MADKLWKQVERRVAELLGGERVPITGRQGSDILHPWLAVEVKERKNFPRYVRKWLNQACIGAIVGQKQDGEDRLPIVVWHEKDTTHANDVVMMYLGDFIDWFGDSDGK